MKLTNEQIKLLLARKDELETSNWWTLIIVGGIFATWLLSSDTLWLWFGVGAAGAFGFYRFFRERELSEIKFKLAGVLEEHNGNKKKSK